MVSNEDVQTIRRAIKESVVKLKTNKEEHKLVGKRGTICVSPLMEFLPEVARSISVADLRNFVKECM